MPIFEWRPIPYLHAADGTFALGHLALTGLMYAVALIAVMAVLVVAIWLLVGVKATGRAFAEGFRRGSSRSSRRS